MNLKIRTKWLLTQLNLLIAALCPNERGAWEGFSDGIIEYDEQYRVFARDKIVLEVGESQSLCLKNTRINQDVEGLTWVCQNQTVIQIRHHEGNQVEILAVSPGTAFVTTQYLDRTYGICLQVGGKQGDSINYMYQMAVIPWQSPVSFFYRPNKGKATKVGFQIFYFQKDQTYFGIPYTNRTAEKLLTNLSYFQQAQDWKESDSEPVRYQGEEIYNLEYPGNDCSTALGWSWNIQGTGREEESFFDAGELFYPATFYLLMMPGNQTITAQKYAVKSIVECPYNMKEGFDTRRAVKQISDLNDYYQNLNPGDGVLRFYRNGLLKSGHVMMVRYHDRKAGRIFFLDQHSPTKRNRPRKIGHQIAPGQSTCSTWYSLTYEQLRKFGYLPIWLNAELHK